MHASRFIIGFWVIGLSCAATVSGQMVVTSTAPSINASNVPVAASIVVTFDRAVQPATVTSSSFWAFGRWSGAVGGTFSFSNGNQTVTLTPDRPFTAGEPVMVLLSHDLTGADDVALRDAGYAVQFTTRARPADLNFTEHQTMSNVTDGQTRIYGAAASDLNEDGWLDLTTVNEVSADLRVFMNLGDGQGTFSDVLLPALEIGIEASPNETGDFNGDGHADIAVAAAETDDVWICLGNGDGTYASPPQGITVGNEPHGVAVLDVDGDGDLDVVNANRGSNNLSLLINDGSGQFGAPVFFDGGVNGEYGLIAGDMNNDAIMDLVVAGRDGQEIRTLLGVGDGTFTMAAAQSTGGATWVATLGDVNNDTHLDASVANSFSGHGAILLGNGDGTFGTATVTNLGAHTVSTDLGDLDGDGDLDWLLSSFGGGFWRLYLNDGAGSFSFNQEFTAVSSPSCSILLDIDNDRDLDLALTDEIADLVTLQKNSGTRLHGDFDNDGAVDAADAVDFESCFSGPGIDAGLACGAGDIDGDGDVDCADWTAFEMAWTAGGTPPPLAQCNGEVPAASTWGLVALALGLMGAGGVMTRARTPSACA